MIRNQEIRKEKIKRQTCFTQGIEIFRKEPINNLKCESSQNSPEKEEENPFFHIPRIDEEPQCEITREDDDDEQEQVMQ